MTDPHRQPEADWHWQLRHCLRTPAALAARLDLTAAERAALDRLGETLPLAITPYYADLLGNDPGDPLRRCVVPTPAEFAGAPGDVADPLGEECRRPVRAIVHRYPDRVLLLAGDRCPTYCRYCTRRRLVGGRDRLGPRDWPAAVAYIAAHPEVRDVLVSGGDPLVYGDGRLDDLLGRLRAIPHVEIVRLGTKVPMVLPQRITPELCAMLHRHQPLYMSIHVVHPRELTPLARAACERLADAGIPLGSQTVLLRGVNDDPETLRTLCRELLRCRVRPYYLLQCDPAPGTGHFRTPVARGIELIDALRGTVSGYGIPQFIVDLPGGAGKVALGPEYVTGRDGPVWHFRNSAGTTGHTYRDPA